MRNPSLRGAGWLPALLLLAGCAAGTAPAVPTPSLAPAPACFAVDGLGPADRALADTLLAAALDNEGLYTLAGPLKPMSSVTTVELRTARRAAVPEGSRAVADSASAGLRRVERYLRVADRLACGTVRMVTVPYRIARDSVRLVQVNVVDRALLDRMLARDLAFWGQWGLVPGSDPAVVATVVEYERPLDRFRGYGYLFGYPEHAVAFFVEAAREGEARGELVPRDFFQIPVHSRETGRFTYAVPEGYAPQAVDEALRAEATRILADYRARRPRYVNPDGTLRAVELLRDWYAESGRTAGGDA